MTHYGMERVAVLVTIVVHSQECPGSVVLYHRKLMGTLKYASVQMNLIQVKTPTWSYLRFTFSKEYYASTHYIKVVIDICQLI